MGLKSRNPQIRAGGLAFTKVGRETAALHQPERSRGVRILLNDVGTTIGISRQTTMTYAAMVEIPTLGIVYSQIPRLN